jgi:uncharacterized ferredoxin-like protein
MNKVTGKLVVFFEEPFWIGIFERIDNGMLSVCKVTFGAEPKDYEVQEFILKNYDKLKFSSAVVEVVETKENINPKRRQREVRKQMVAIGIGTKSQQVLKLQQEQNKTIRKSKTREQKEEELEKRFALKQQKRKEKHKGR